MARGHCQRRPVQLRVGRVEVGRDQVEREPAPLHLVERDQRTAAHRRAGIIQAGERGGRSADLDQGIDHGVFDEAVAAGASARGAPAPIHPRRFVPAPWPTRGAPAVYPSEAFPEAVARRAGRDTGPRRLLLPDVRPRAGRRAHRGSIRAPRFPRFARALPPRRAAPAKAGRAAPGAATELRLHPAGPARRPPARVP